MNVMVVFDSQFGNTQIIAEAIAEGLKKEKVKIAIAEKSKIRI